MNVVKDNVVSYTDFFLSTSLQKPGTGSSARGAHFLMALLS